MENVAVLVFALLGCGLGLFRLIHENGTRNRIYGIFTFCASIALLISSIYMISYDHDILFFAPKYKNVSVDIPPNTEKSSILYLFSEYIESGMTSEEVRGVLDATHQVTSSFETDSMRYSKPKYTLNNIESDYIYAQFSKSGPKGKIRSITWQHEGRDTELYYQLLEYLTAILGKPIIKEDSAKRILTADWEGFHLECNDFRVSFGRVFN